MVTWGAATCSLFTKYDKTLRTALYLLQDELLGLANDSQEGYLAEEIDPTVVHRQVEDRQVQLGL